MTYKKRCQVCGRLRPMTKHHIMKRSVFGQNDNVVLVCRQCHDKIENVIRDKENAILIEHPEIYTQTWEDFKRGMYYDRNQKRVAQKKH